MSHAIGPLALGQRAHDKLCRLTMRDGPLDMHAHPDQGRLAVPEELLRFLRGTALQVVATGKAFGGENNLRREDR